MEANLYFSKVMTPGGNLKTQEQMRRTKNGK